MFESKKQMKENVILMLFFCVISVGYLLVFSLSTSFLYEKSYFGSDSDIFVLMGKLTKDGLIPYKDFFDHKGPVIFFIEYVGLMISDGKKGIFLIQVLFLTFSMCGIYKILKLFYEKKRSVILTIFCLLVFNVYFSEGNLTEEYCLPFLIWSFYFSIKYLRNKKSEEQEHKSMYAFLYGITFMICALTRLTNALPLCTMIIILFVVMVRKKQWKAIIKNILFFIMGSLIILIPFIIYYIQVDAIYEMIYATFLYNIKYAMNNDILLGWKDKINQIALIIPLVSALIMGICYSIWNKKDKVIGVSVIVLGLIAIVFQLRGFPYAHYIMIWIPLIVLTLGILGDISRKNKISKILVSVSILMSVVVIGGKVVTKADEIYANLNSEKAKNYSIESQEIVEQIEEEALDSVIAYNVPAYFYISTNIKPCYKYCILQDWQCSKAEDMYEEFKNDMESLKAKYVVISKDGSHMLDYILEENYYKVGSTNSLVLLKKK